MSNNSKEQAITAQSRNNEKGKKAMNKAYYKTTTWRQHQICSGLGIKASKNCSNSKATVFPDSAWKFCNWFPLSGVGAACKTRVCFHRLFCPSNYANLSTVTSSIFTFLFVPFSVRYQNRPRKASNCFAVVPLFPLFGSLAGENQPEVVQAATTEASGCSPGRSWHRSFQLLYFLGQVAHLSYHGVDLLGHLCLLWLRDAGVRLLSLLEVAFHLDYPGGQLPSFGGSCSRIAQ
ncbi:hypothetical protein T05_8442 [Trichinella murrelli]|uniref:Uncharacterized protein n=1 Tax=Trichinella murrelli TaxID=144512 RepID=A0A0V0TP61_9BILA|nr:hypothetical protein T05_8442 [Trichinella murrelli]